MNLPATWTTAAVSLATRDLSSQVLDREGRLKVMPASFYAETTPDERRLLCSRQGVYSLPTTELIAWLKDFVGGRRAMEIGSGSGAICRALRIRGTDNFMQDRPDISAIYQGTGQATVKYSPQVERIAAYDAVRKFKPQVVIAAWVTHLYNPAEHWREGNQWGVDERDIIENCEAYVFVGNRHTHRNKPIWDLPHTVIEPDWLYSRAMTDAADFIAVWERAKL